MTLTEIRRRLRTSASAHDAVFLQRFFKTGPGEYAEGDRFLGVRAPALRALARESDALPFSQILSLLHSPWHEERVLALFIWVRRFERDEASLKKTIYGLYLENRAHINNWDLVDVSAPHIVGTWLLNQPRAKLHTLARSKILWDRRVAMVATFAFIRAGQFDDTLALARRFLHDSHDLMHKATGWMLREVGKRDEAILKQFLDQQVAAMPSIMLSYATEKFPPAVRRHYQQRRRLG